MDSHLITGKPISSVLAMAAKENENETLLAMRPTCKQDSAATPPGPAQSLQNHNLAEPQIHTTNASNGRGGREAHQTPPLCLERLLATSGYGVCHTINVKTKPTKLLEPSLGTFPPAEDGKHRDSIANNNGDYIHVIRCLMGISPVVSFPDTANIAFADKDQNSHHNKSKRRKHHDHPEKKSNGIHQQRHKTTTTESSVIRKQLVSHLVVQLHPLDRITIGSHTSQPTVETQILGSTKSDHRMTANSEKGASHSEENEPSIDRMDSDSNETGNPATAIG